MEPPSQLQDKPSTGGLSRYSRVPGAASEPQVLCSGIVVPSNQLKGLESLDAWKCSFILHICEIVWDSWSAFENAGGKTEIWCIIERQFPNGYFCLTFMPHHTNLENLSQGLLAVFVVKV